jgi:hypothetical protein
MACLGPPKELQDQVQDLIISSLGPTETSLHGTIQLVLARPRNQSPPREGPRQQFLRANRDIFASQHVNSHGPPKESTEATSKIYFSLAN